MITNNNGRRAEGIKAMWWRLAVAFLALGLVLALTGCEGVLQQVLFSASFEASEGDYPDRIQVEWSGTHPWSDDSPDYETTYSLWREKGEISPVGAPGGAELETGITATSYDDLVPDNATFYWYYITADGPGTEEQSAGWERGYRMDSASLKIYSAGGTATSHVVSADSNDNADAVWFHFEAQQGWQYRFNVSEAAVGEVVLQLFRDGLGRPYQEWENTLANGDQYVWQCTESNSYYLKAAAAASVVDPVTFELTARHD